MFENIAALDIGSSCIKLITVKTGLKNFQVTSMSYEDISYNSENPDDDVIISLKKIIEENNLKGYTILSNMPMEKATIRNITFPFNDVEKIASAIPFEAEENIPFKIDDIVLDFQSQLSPNPAEGRIMLAATPKEALRNYLKIFEECGLQPAKIGLESNAIFECYKYFNQIKEETIIQLDIGNKKTIINIVKDNHLLYTRCLGIGTGAIYEDIAAMNKTSVSEAKSLYESLNMDLTSLENNYQKEIYKTIKLPKPKLKKIYEISLSVIEALIEQIFLTVKSFAIDYGELSFNRILISGGGAQITGIGYLFSASSELPVVSLPFLQNYTEQKIQNQFPTVFGTVLSYIDKKQPSVNLLKGEFLPDFVSQSKKIYYLAIAFGILTLFTILINFGVSSYLRYKNTARYEVELNARFAKYFHSHQPGKDCLGSALKIVNDQKKELESMDIIVQTGDKILNFLNDILGQFPNDPSFQLSNLVINESVIRVDGLTSSSKNLDDFKNKLTESKKFDSVTLNTNLNKKNEINFSMVIKQKISGDLKKKQGKETE